MGFQRPFGILFAIFGLSSVTITTSPLSQQLFNAIQVDLGNEGVIRSKESLEYGKLENPVRNELKILGQSHHLCTRDEIKQGAWLPVRLRKPPYISKTSHLRCYPMEAYKKNHWDTYDWFPNSNCEFVPWKTQKFCSIVKRATILIIGDSLSWEHFSSMAQLLGLRVLQSAQHVSKAQQRNHVQLACNDTVRIVFRRDDLLTNLTESIKRAFPQVVVVNRGAHYQNDTKFLPAIQHNIEELKSWKEACKRMNIRCHLFWRTSVPGHPLCFKMNFTKPSNNLSEMEAWVKNFSNYDNHTIKYHWYDYKRQNDLVLEMLDKMMDDEYDVMDAYHLNMLRPDEHRAHEGDCLHNCYPGKMDVYSRLLLHFLMMRRSSEDTKDLEDRYNRAMIRKSQEDAKNQEDRHNRAIRH